MKEKKSPNNLFRYIIVFGIFLVVGCVIGYFGTNSFLQTKNKNNKNNNKPIKDIVDITNDSEYKTTIERLYSFINKNVEFYNSNGITINNMNDDLKFRLVYNYIIQNELAEKETIDSIYPGSIVCNNDFLVDTNIDDNGNSTNLSTCTLKKISTEQIKKVYMTLFNNNYYNLKEAYNPINNQKCILSNDNYLCGKITSNNEITGEVENHFKIIKVTKNAIGTINIYDQGYLQDTRSNIALDSNIKYYLHSIDSSDYYYELKSSDNYTFVHVFEKNDDNTYHYVKTEIVDNK